MSIRFLLEHQPSGRHRWWTFAGGAANGALALRLGELGSTRADDLWVEVDAGVPVPNLIHSRLEDSTIASLGAKLAARHGLKFAACLRSDLAAGLVVGRPIDVAKLCLLLKSPTKD